MGASYSIKRNSPGYLDITASKLPRSVALGILVAAGCVEKTASTALNRAEAKGSTKYVGIWTIECEV